MDPDSASGNSDSLLASSEPFSFTNVSSNMTVEAKGPVTVVPIFVKFLMYFMYITISVVAIGGNGIVCYIVMAYQRMRTVTNFFIVNLAIGDILMASLCIPLTFVANLVLFRWPFGAVMCPIVSYVQCVSVFVSAYTLVAISIDRYIAIIYPLRPRMTKLQAKIIIFLVWVVALITPLPTAIYSTLSRPQNWSHTDSAQVCMEVWETKEQRYYYSMALMVLQYFFPLSVLIFTYARIAFIVWGKRVPGEAEDNRDQRLAASKRKMVKMMITVVVIFTLCWLPFNIIMVIGDNDESFWLLPYIYYGWFATHWLAMSHACYNPVVYCWMNARFRDGFRHVFRRLPCPRCLLVSRRHDDENGLKRCNTYTTSYTSVRTTSLRGGVLRTGSGGTNNKVHRATYVGGRVQDEMHIFKSNHNSHQYDDDPTSTTMVP